MTECIIVSAKRRGGTATYLQGGSSLAYASGYYRLMNNLT